MQKNSLYKIIAYPALIWFTVFLLLPVLLVVAISFSTRGTYGNIQWIFQSKNYQAALQVSYLLIFLKSLWMATVTAMTCTVLGFFIAWAIATANKKTRQLWLIVMILPFLTNLIIRIYATKLLVGVDGPLQYTLQFLGIEFDPFYFTANPFLVFYGLASSYLPFAIFPMYAAFEKFDFDLVEAAIDLGASTKKIIFGVVMPNLRNALVSGFSLVFIPCLGEYVIPDLLGGAKQMLLGNLIVENFLRARNWPVGAAISVCVFILLGLFFILVNSSKGERHRRTSPS